MIEESDIYKKYDVIISIKPEYVKAIINGIKKFEFRKSIFRRDIRRIYVYETRPLKKIIGYFDFDGYYEDIKQGVWEKCSEESGISKEGFFEYYINSQKAIAIKINKFILFDKPIDPKDHFKGFVPPQSFKYIEVGCLE